MTWNSNAINRRTFLGAAAGLMIVKPHLARGTQANSAVRVGLLGCGGRGTAVATSMVTNAGGRVVALADLFQEQLDKARAHFNGLAEKNGYAAIEPALIFGGVHSSEQIAACKEVDAVVVATPVYFHPQHLSLVVEAGKHAYCEKPVAVDVAGALHILDVGRKAEGRLSLEVGFQIRSAPPFVELVRRIRAGDLGEIAFGEAHYYCPAFDTGYQAARPEQTRLRRWHYDRVLSGDVIVEQNVHVIDICNWVLQGHPVKAVGSGGRKGRNGQGDNLGHSSVTFTYPDDVHVNFASRQFGKGDWDVSESFFGTSGNSRSPYSGPLGIYGDKPWQWAGAQSEQKQEGFSTSGSFTDNLAQADPEKHKCFLESITSGRFRNQAALGVESSLSAMLGRTAMYTGREVTWDEMVRSKERWDAHLDLEKLV